MHCQEPLHYTIHIPPLLFWMVLCSILVFHNIWHYYDPSPVAWSPSFLSQKKSCHQLSGRHFFWLVWWMCVHLLLWLLFGFNIHKFFSFCIIPFYLQSVLVHSANCVNNIYSGKLQVTSPVTHMMWMKNSSSSLCYHPKKSKPRKPFHTFCALP
jgi:hypothetical protein